MNFFGLKEADAPTLVGFEMAKNRKYRLHEDLKCVCRLGRSWQAFLPSRTAHRSISSMCQLHSV